MPDGQPPTGEDKPDHIAHQPQRTGARKQIDDARTLDIEPLPAVTDPEESLRNTLTIWGTDNIQKRYLITKGRADNAPLTRGCNAENLAAPFKSPRPRLP